MKTKFWKANGLINFLTYCAYSTLTEFGSLGQNEHTNRADMQLEKIMYCC